MEDVEQWIKNLKTTRIQKDSFFGSGHPQSPIQYSDLSNFSGLNYYPINPEYKFELELKEHKDKKVLEVQDTKGAIRELIRWGEFHFKINDKNCVLQTYKSNPNEDRLFILFRDETSGNETYGAGRYLDLEEKQHKNSEGKWILDFNAAYNPWCAYNDNYACPYVPPENCLDVKVEAGEKNYSK